MRESAVRGSQVWFWMRRMVLTALALLAVAAQVRISQRDETTWPECLALAVAVMGFLVLAWTRWKVQGTLLVLASYLVSVALPGTLNNGLWFLLLPLLVDANSPRPRWQGLTIALAVIAGSVFDLAGHAGEAGSSVR